MQRTGIENLFYTLIFILLTVVGSINIFSLLVGKGDLFSVIGAICLVISGCLVFMICDGLYKCIYLRSDCSKRKKILTVVAIIIYILLVSIPID